jgi:hypothetical protein
VPYLHGCVSYMHETGGGVRYCGIVVVHRGERFGQKFPCRGEAGLGAAASLFAAATASSGLGMYVRRHSFLLFVTISFALCG